MELSRVRIGGFSNPELRESSSPEFGFFTLQGRNWVRVFCGWILKVESSQGKGLDTPVL